MRSVPASSYTRVSLRCVQCRFMRCLDSVANDAPVAQLLAHEFLFSKEMMEGSNGRLCYALGCMMLGCALMALLGRWA